MRLQQCPLIEQCVVVGQDAKFVCALILPDLEACREAGFAADSLAGLIQLPELRERLLQEIKIAMTDPAAFKRYEVVKDFRFLDRPLEVGEELTSLFKLKRHVIHERYAGLISEMQQPHD
jgi:long-chain acyl-CoA synthetase